MENKKIQEKNYILWKWAQQHKTPSSQKTQESVHNGNTKCTIVAQKCNNTNIQACSTSNIQNMHLVPRHIHKEPEDTLASSEEDIEGQMQTANKRRQYKDREHKREQNKCVNTGQGNNQSK